MSGDPDMVRETESSNPEMELLEAEKDFEIEQQMVDLVRCSGKLRLSMI